MAAGDLTTLEAVKQWLNLPQSNTSADDVLQELIGATSADFLRAIDRADFLQATYTEVREGDGGPRLTLRHWPIDSVATVTIAGVAVQVSPDGVAAGYQVVAQPDPERKRDLFMVGGAAFTDRAAVSVTYTAGYNGAPQDVAQAVTEWVVLRWRSRPGVGVSAQRDAGGEQTTFEAEPDMPATVKAVAMRYKRCWPNLDKRQDDRDYAKTSITRVFTRTEKAS